METKNNKHIDLTYLKQLSNGSNEFISQMINVFMAQTPEALANMEKYVNAKDWESLHRVAHKMKPSFSFMGIKELENTIGLIEEHSFNKTNVDELPAMIMQVKNVCMDALSELEVEKKMFI